MTTNLTDRKIVMVFTCAKVSTLLGKEQLESKLAELAFTYNDEIGFDVRINSYVCDTKKNTKVVMAITHRAPIRVVVNFMEQLKIHRFSFPGDIQKIEIRGDIL